MTWTGKAMEARCGERAELWAKPGATSGQGFCSEVAESAMHIVFLCEQNLPAAPATSPVRKRQKSARVVAAVCRMCHQLLPDVPGEASHDAVVHELVSKDWAAARRSQLGP